MATHWNHRVVRRTYNSESNYGVYEAYYTDGRVVSITMEPVTPQGESMDELREELAMMARACEHPVLDYDNIPETE